MTGLVPAIHAAQRNERLKKASINPRRALRLSAFAAARADVARLFTAARRGWPGQARP
jgi:hypothetical protein